MLMLAQSFVLLAFQEARKADPKAMYVKFFAERRRLLNLS
jgi:hypothetical protein